MDSVEAGIDLHLRGEWAKAAEVLAPAIAVARDSGDHARAVLGTIVLGVAEHLLGHGERAAVLCAEAVERSAEWPSVHARAHWEKGVMYQDADAIDRAVALWNGISDTDPEASLWAMRGVAYAAALRGDLATAEQHYPPAIAALEQKLGANHPRLVGVYADLAAFHDRRKDPDAAHTAHTRAFEIARAFAGPGAQVTMNTAYHLATRNAMAGIACFDACIAAAKDALELAKLWYARAAVVAKLDPTEGLQSKEASLRHRERALGMFDHALIPNRDEIKRGWTELGNTDEAEAFLHRCRALTTPDTWLYRNFTYEIGYLLSGAQRREEYADLWKDFLKARETVCAPGAQEIIEAFEIVGEKLPHYVPAAELLALSERALALKETRGGLRALAKAYRRDDRRDEARATWKRTVDRWIEDLRAGVREHEPAIAEWANDYEGWGSFPTTEPPSAAQLAAAAVYDDAYARAVEIVGADEPALGKLIVERASQLSRCSMRSDEAGKDLERARALLERVEGPHGETVNYALFELSEHHHRFSSRDVAITWLRELIRVRTEAKVFEAHYDRGRLAEWLERRGNEGDVAEALAIREQLVLDWPSGAPNMITNELKEIARIHLERGDLATATATCERFAGLAHHAKEYGHCFTLDAWWTLARAKCDAGDLDGARAAIDAIVELWRVPEMIAFIETKQRDAFESNLPIANHLYARIGERVFAGVEESRALATSIAPELTADTALVLADALTAAGDPRGELIVLHHRIASAPDDKSLTDRQLGLIVEHRTRWMGPLAEDRITWHLGYWKAIRLRGYPRAVFENLAAILEHPSAHYLDTIVFEDTPADLDPVICAAAALLARVPHVQMTNLDDDDRLATLRAAIPTLEVVA